MGQLTADLPGVAVYFDDILVSGEDSKYHQKSLQRLLQCLEEKGLLCRQEKCQLAKKTVDYLGHHLSKEGIAKGTKADAVSSMPPPKDISSLRPFLGSVQFYGKFLPHLATEAEPLPHLTKRNVDWKWGKKEEKVFNRLKNLLSTNDILKHFGQSLPLGLPCDATNVRVGAVVFHRFPDGSERPITNASKTLTKSQRNYSKIQKRLWLSLTD